MKELKFEIKVEYDSITYDGTNAHDVYDFAVNHRLVGEDVYHDYEAGLAIRPEGIPNLDEYDLLKWWESTGEIVTEESRWTPGRTYNTHNSNNLPIWRKDEDFMIAFKCNRDGYVNRRFFQKGMGIVVFGGDFHIGKWESQEDIERWVISKIKDKYDNFPW